MAYQDSSLCSESINCDTKPEPNYHNYENFKILYSGINDEEYQEFLKVRHTYASNWYTNSKVDNMFGSIFSAPSDFSLAMSISADLKMDNGVALKLRKTYNCAEIIKEQNVETGGLAFFKDKDTERFIHYLVVMPEYNVCPTYYTIWMCLQKLKANVLKYEIKKIAMSHIGCGIAPSLTWELVKPMIEYVFRDVSIEINAFEGKSSCIHNHDIEDCYCYGGSFMQSEIDVCAAHCSKQRNMVLANSYYKNKEQEHKNNNYNCYDEAEKENFSGYRGLAVNSNFWDINDQNRDYYEHGTQGEYSAYNILNTLVDTHCRILGANPYNTPSEDVYHNYCVRVGNDFYIKYSTEDAANDYYGALY